MCVCVVFSSYSKNIKQTESLKGRRDKIFKENEVWHFYVDAWKSERIMKSSWIPGQHSGPLYFYDLQVFECSNNSIMLSVSVIVRL